MGYYTRFTEEIEITPPLTWKQIKNSPFLIEKGYGSRDIKFRLESSRVETDYGWTMRTDAVAVIPVTEEEMKGYDIEKHLQELIDAFPEHTFSGFFECKGEETGDLWRLKVKDGKAVRVEPSIVWPED